MDNLPIPDINTVSNCPDRPAMPRRTRNDAPVSYDGPPSFTMTHQDDYLTFDERCQVARAARLHHGAVVPCCHPGEPFTDLMPGSGVAPIALVLQAQSEALDDASRRWFLEDALPALPASKEEAIELRWAEARPAPYTPVPNR